MPRCFRCGDRYKAQRTPTHSASQRCSVRSLLDLSDWNGERPAARLKAVSASPLWRYRTMTDKAEIERVEDAATQPDAPAKAEQMRSGLDDLSIWESLRRYKVVTGIAMAAAFSASLDGYRMF